MDEKETQSKHEAGEEDDEPATKAETNLAPRSGHLLCDHRQQNNSHIPVEVP